MSEVTAGVLLGERRVGTLTFASEVTRFDYTDTELDHPVLGQAFEDYPARIRTARMDAPAWFANPLPEHDTPLRRLIADQFGIKAVRSYPLLLALGEDLPGAVVVRPDDGVRPELSGAEPGHEWLGSLAFSLAGVQLKFSMAREQVFVIRRFDRSATGRVHIEDLAQVREVAPRRKYDNTSYDAIGRVITTLTGPAGTDEYVRRLVVSIAAGNADAHLKNWSLIYRDGRTPALAPAYDLVSVTVYERFAASRLAFRLGGERDFDKIDIDHFRRFADGVGTDPEAVAAMVESTVDALRRTWPAVLAEHPVPGFLARYIGDRLDRLPLTRR